MSDHQDPANALLSERIRSIFPSETVANKVVDIVANNRPVGWSRKSYAPYFKECYAKQLIPSIDKMIENGTGLMYRYSMYCDESKGQMTRNTLYLRINQSINFLCEYLDPTGKYRKWRDSTNVRRDKQLEAITIEYLPEFTNGVAQGFQADEIVQKIEQPRWKRAMEEWLESGETRPFILEKIALSTDEVTKLRTELRELRGIQAMVASNCIKIIRINV